MTQDRRVNDNAIYQTLGRIEGTLTGLDQKVDVRFAALEKKVDETKTYAEKTSARVGSLEVWRGWMIGAAAAAGAVASWFTHLFGFSK